MKKSRSGLRPFSLKASVVPHAEGSCLVSMGGTKVLCVVSFEPGAPKFAEDKGTGWVTAEYAMLPRAGLQRTNRRKAFQGGRAQEISRLIGRSLRAGIDLSALAGWTVIVDCDVIQADGGTRTASINGGLVALGLAFKKFFNAGKISQWPLVDFVSAVSVGMVDGKAVLDMSYEEDSQAEADINLVLNQKGQLIEIQGTAEQKPFTVKNLNTIITLAQGAAKTINKAQKKILSPIPKK